jgi:hypothetical protein
VVVQVSGHRRRDVVEVAAADVAVAEEVGTHIEVHAEA